MVMAPEPCGKYDATTQLICMKSWKYLRNYMAEVFKSKPPIGVFLNKTLKIMAKAT